MPICTYLSDDEVKNFTVTDKDVLEWMNITEKVTGKRPIVEEKTVYRRRWLHKPKAHVIYSLYIEHDTGWADDIPIFVTEYQIMNFCGNSDWSVNTQVGKSQLVNYLIGYVGGWEAAHNRISQHEHTEYIIP